MDGGGRFGNDIPAQRLGPLAVTYKFSPSEYSEWTIGVFDGDQQFGWLFGANDVTDPLVEAAVVTSRMCPRRCAEPASNDFVNGTGVLSERAYRCVQICSLSRCG